MGTEPKTSNLLIITLKRATGESQHHRNSYLPHEKMAREYSKNMSDIFIIISIYIFAL